MKDAGREPTIVTILELVADASDTDPAELEPLYDSIDPDALETLHRHGFDGEVTFRYGGCDVTVTGDSEIDVERIDGSTEPDT